MRVLLTGCTGFVGKSVLQKNAVIDSDDQISLLSSVENTEYQTYIYEKKECGYQWQIPDDFDVLVHIGAWIPKSTSESQNINKAFDNIQYTKFLLQSLSNLKRIVFISTIDVYAPTYEKINEESLVNPISLYAFSKLYCEEIVKAWSIQNSIDCCILRLGHIYGTGEAAFRKLIPMLIRQAINNETINIFSSGNELRSFLNIDDCADVIWQAAKGKMQGLYNVTSGHAVSVKEIAYLIKSLTQSKSEIVIQNRPIETRDYVFDNAHLKKSFKITEKSLEQGLKEEIEYFKTIRQ